MLVEMLFPQLNVLEDVPRTSYGPLLPKFPQGESESTPTRPRVAFCRANSFPLAAAQNLGGKCPIGLRISLSMAQDVVPAKGQDYAWRRRLSSVKLIFLWGAKFNNNNDL